MEANNPNQVRDVSTDDFVRKLLDVSFLLAIGTAFLYFLNVEYLYIYYAFFGVDYTSLPLGLPETLVACPYLIIVMTWPLSGIISGSFQTARWPLRMLYIDKNNLTLTALGYLTATFFFVIFAMALGAANGIYFQHSAPLATVSMKDETKPIEGYHLLKVTDKQIYLFKATHGLLPEILILNPETVKSIGLTRE